MPQEYLVNMDLFVGRSRATFLAEVTALGVPCILIPSPYVTANHQEYNARSLQIMVEASCYLRKS